MGVDGAPRGWVGVVWDGDQVHALYRTTLAELFKAAGRPSVVAIDMPIGLLESGPRQSELAARAFLSTRRSSVFPSPIRAVIDGSDFADYSATNALSRTHTGRGLSKQSFNLFPKIVEVERWHEQADVTACEVHPEVSFQVLAGRPLLHGKKTSDGVRERRALLTAAGWLAPEVGDCRPARIDDVLDATVAAWTALRIATGSARSFPADPQPGEPTIWA